MKLVVIGTVFVDIKGYPLGDFIPTGRNAGRIQQFHGGVARNIAEDIANYGRQSMLVGLVDEGGIGEDVVKHLKSRNVDTSHIRATEDGMGTWLAIFDKKGDVCANISKRTNLLPICDILEEEGDQIFSEAEAILVEIDIEEQIVQMIFELNKKYQKKIYAVTSNISIAKDRMPFILQSDCFICNRNEAALFFDLPEDDFSSIDKALESLRGVRRDKRPSSMVVTLDSEGAVYVSDTDGSGHVAAKLVKVVDTTGAGDSFFAGVSMGLTSGLDLENSCRLGNEIAARVIGSLGNVYQ